MSKQKLNCEMVKDSMIESYREHLKRTIADGAGFLALDELTRVVNDVVKEMLSFLSAPANASSGQQTETNGGN